MINNKNDIISFDNIPASHGVYSVKYQFLEKGGSDYSQIEYQRWSSCFSIVRYPSNKILMEFNLDSRIQSAYVTLSPIDPRT
jgi:hypothetical protein